jgi:predicted flap endonuclease-1-like 5' DNA nuclease
MLNLLTFIWFCLLIAFLLGLLLGYALWHGHQKTAQAKEAEALDVSSRKALEERDKQLTVLQAERDKAREETLSLNARIDELTRSVEDITRQKALLETGPRTLGDLAGVTTERDQLRAALTQANTNIQTANAKLQEQSTELERLRTSLSAAPIAPAAPSALSEVAAAALATTGLVIPPVEQDRTDDLKEIIGVGPFIESKLRGLGLQTFKQIALLSPAMLEKVAENIEYFQGRIGRENWIEQCKALHFDKYGEKL